MEAYLQYMISQLYSASYPKVLYTDNEHEGDGQKTSPFLQAKLEPHPTLQLLLLKEVIICTNLKVNQKKFSLIAHVVTLDSLQEETGRKVFNLHK